jgi:hypothetical protein
MGEGQQECTEEMLIIQDTREHTRTQRFTMFVVAARSALTFALLRQKKRKTRPYAPCIMQAYKATFA